MEDNRPGVQQHQVTYIRGAAHKLAIKRNCKNKKGEISQKFVTKSLK